MATRSRLGRDPLQGAAKPTARATGRKTTKKAAAGAEPPQAPQTPTIVYMASQTSGKATLEDLYLFAAGVYSETRPSAKLR